MKFVEAGHGNGGGNWGKFAIGRPTAEEWAEPAQFPGCEREPPLMHLRGRRPGQGWVWVMDLSTGEGALFQPGPGMASADLREHQIWVCPMFEPMLTWLYEQVQELGERWWEKLPRYVELPNAPFAFHGHRRSRS